MKTYAILLLLILSGVSAVAQNEPPQPPELPKQFMFESKFKDLALRLIEDKKTVEASANYFGTPCIIEMGEIVRSYDPRYGDRYFIQIKNDEVIFDTYETPEMTEEEAREQLIAVRVDPDTPVEVIDHKSVWYFEPSDEEGYFYIVTPYDPYPGQCLTINNEVRNGEYEVILAPKKNSLNADQKWRLILLPRDE